MPKTSHSGAAHDLMERGEQMATKAKFAWIARIGYAARGVAYVLVGGLALLAAIGRGGRTTGTQGALRSLIDEPFGQTLLVLLAIGLFAYALWRAVQAIFDADGHGTAAKGIAVRVGLGVSAITHTFLAVYAVGIAFGWGFGGSGGGGGAASWSARALRWSGGRWLLGLVGVAIVGAGIAQFVKGWKEKYRRYLAMDWPKMRWANPVCKAGLIARGIVFGLIGVFVIVAAAQAQPSEARGLGGTLRTIQGQAYGQILLALTALGLIAFGIYSMIEAKYRRIGDRG